MRTELIKTTTNIFELGWMRVLNRLSAVDQRWLAGMDSVINKETLKLNLLLTLLSPATRWERLSIYQVLIWIDHWPVDLGWGGISKFDIQSKYQMTLLSNYGLRSPLPRLSNLYYNLSGWGGNIIFDRSPRLMVQLFNISLCSFVYEKFR